LVFVAKIRAVIKLGSIAAKQPGTNNRSYLRAAVAPAALRITGRRTTRTCPARRTSICLIANLSASKDKQSENRHK
jgi:hypothetical protein